MVGTGEEWGNSVRRFDRTVLLQMFDLVPVTQS